MYALAPNIRLLPTEFVNAPGTSTMSAHSASVSAWGGRWAGRAVELVRARGVAMIFSSASFMVFFVAVLVVYAGARTPGQRAGVLLAASIIFYASWKPIYLLLIGASVTTKLVRPRRHVASAFTAPC